MSSLDRIDLMAMREQISGLGGYEGRANAYASDVSRLKKQNDALREQLKKNQDEGIWSIIFMGVIALLCIIVFA